MRLQLELLKPRAGDGRGAASNLDHRPVRRRPHPPPERGGEAATPSLAALSRFYEEARRFARLATEASLAESRGRRGVIVTGGGPGVMEAGNRGAREAGGRSVGLNIVLPHEQAPNLYVTPELSFNFHYFAIRKMHFLMRAEAVCVFPGGFGTLDEMFEALTLIQTGRMARVPFLLFGRDVLGADHQLGGAGRGRHHRAGRPRPVPLRRDGRGGAGGDPHLGAARDPARGHPRPPQAHGTPPAP